MTTPDIPDINRLTCLTCHQTIESMHRHDFVRCGCPEDSDTAVYADGGPAYIRRLYGRRAQWQEADGRLCRGCDVDPSAE